MTRKRMPAGWYARHETAIRDMLKRGATAAEAAASIVEDGRSPTKKSMTAALWAAGVRINELRHGRQQVTDAEVVALALELENSAEAARRLGVSINRASYLVRRDAAFTWAGRDAQQRTQGADRWARIGEAEARHVPIPTRKPMPARAKQPAGDDPWAREWQALVNDLMDGGLPQRDAEERATVAMQRRLA